MQHVLTADLLNGYSYIAIIGHAYNYYASIEGVQSKLKPKYYSV